MIMSSRMSSRTKPVFVALLAVLALVAGTVSSISTATRAAAAMTDDLVVAVVDDNGAAILSYQWLLAKEDTGNPRDALTSCLPTSNGPSYSANPGGTCQWPSIRETSGAVPLVSSGDESNLSLTTALNGGDATKRLAPGRYLLSVQSDGYQLGGEHVTMTADGVVRVDAVLHKYPIPLGTVKVRVFKDTVPVDGTYEANAEAVLPGFEGHLSDVFGAVTTDYFGNPLCTMYVHTAPDLTHPQGQMTFDVNGAPVVDAAKSTGHCYSNASGDITIPNLGPNRYGVTVTTPAGQGSAWVQTTNLEGGHDHDVWTQQNDTGLDTELVIGGEPVPAVQFGFVPPTAAPATWAGNTGSITGRAMVGLNYIGGQGGIQAGGEVNTSGGKLGGPVSRPWVSLSDLEHGDQMVFTGRGAADGTFAIPNVPNGTYQLTLWDDAQDLIIWSFNVTVSKGQAVDVGVKTLVGWFTTIEGSVFIDSNANGVKDPGESGVPGTTVTLRERDNSLMDQFTNTVTTDASGRYSIKEAYPLSKWLVLEHFNTRYEGTGVTTQAYNEDVPTTYKGAGVDINVLPVIGIGGRVDWGVRPYAPGTNGGIAGTVTYDTTRNELDPRDAASEGYQPGIPGIPVHLYAVERDGNGDPVINADGSVKRGPQLADTYTSETWAPPKGCTARQWDGTPLTDQLALPAPGDASANCLESPMNGFQAAPSDADPAGFSQTVNGNYGIASATHNLYAPGEPENPAPDLSLPLYAPLHCGTGASRMADCAGGADYDYPDQSLRADDYLVGVDIPKDAYGRDLYQVTREEDVNVFNGDGYLPQENFPVTSVSPSGGAPSGANPVPAPPSPPSQSAGIVASCAGPNHTVTVSPVTNQAFIDGGGSPFESQQRPLCSDKLVTVRGQQAVAPNFNLFTQVPLPTHFWGLVINDLGLSYDKRSANYGEAQGIANVPVGIYDWTGRLVDTVDTDFNGFYESLLPSTSTYNCPLPAGPCANIYRFVGNDPGPAGRPNPNHSNRFRSIAANFQAYPGLYTVTDTAPTMSAATVLTPGATDAGPPPCDINTSTVLPAQATPELFTASKVVFGSAETGAARTVTLRGKGFGDLVTTGPTPSAVMLDAPGGLGTPLSLPITSWTDDQIVVTAAPFTGSGASARLVHVRNGNGRTSINGISLQLLGTVDIPTVLTVDSKIPLTNSLPVGTFRTVQAALVQADRNAGTDIVVVEPGKQGPFNPEGAYLENLVVHRPVRLQGHGPGGQPSSGAFAFGSVLDGQGFDPDSASGTSWLTEVARLPHQAPVPVPDSAGITVLPVPNWPSLSGQGAAGIDGFKIMGNTQSNFAGNVNVLTGVTSTAVGAAGSLVTQGGGIYLHAGAVDTAITDNLITGNSGAYAGGIRVGTPYGGDLGNRRVRIGYNQVRDNGGTNLAGGIGLFTGSNAYQVDHNELCGNFSAEYGGGLTHYGLSNNGSITNNRVYFNTSYDEGGGLMVAGELPTNPDVISAGSGRVTISGNEIVQNLGGDDGGGIRLLQAGNFRVRVDNNVLADNVSTHEGGGIALNDSPNVEFVSNTVMNNLTTATALTSDGTPAPAGLATTANSAALQTTLPLGSPLVSKPVLFNNIFWDNRAASWDQAAGRLTGIGLAGDTTPIRNWDMGSQDGATLSVPNRLRPRHSVLQTLSDTDVTATNQILTAINVSTVDPNIPKAYDISVSLLNWRGFPAFRQTLIVTRALPAHLQGDYRLPAAPAVSSAVDRGRTFLSGNPAPTTGTVLAPLVDLTGKVRLSLTNTVPDAGAYER